MGLFTRLKACMENAAGIPIILYIVVVLSHDSPAQYFAVIVQQQLVCSFICSCIQIVFESVNVL